jgi:hypothetical protein
MRGKRLGDPAATRSGAPSLPTRRTPDSPVRERGSPTGQENLLVSGPACCSLSLGKGETWHKEKRAGGKLPSMAGWESGFGWIQTLQPMSGEEEIQDFWGQLWYFPNSHPRPDWDRVRACQGENLVWIRRDLWRSKSFLPCWGGRRLDRVAIQVEIRGAVLG